MHNVLYMYVEVWYDDARCTNSDIPLNAPTQYVLTNGAVHIFFYHIPSAFLWVPWVGSTARLDPIRVTPYIEMTEPNLAPKPFFSQSWQTLPSWLPSPETQAVRA